MDSVPFLSLLVCLGVYEMPTHGLLSGIFIYRYTKKKNRALDYQLLTIDRSKIWKKKQEILNIQPYSKFIKNNHAYHGQTKQLFNCQPKTLIYLYINWIIYLMLCLLPGILVWVTIWIIMGDTAAPGGQLFMLSILTIVAYFGGILLMKITTLPALIGMLFIGIIMKNIGFVEFDEDYQHVTSYIRYFL